VPAPKNVYSTARFQAEVGQQKEATRQLGSLALVTTGQIGGSKYVEMLQASVKDGNFAIASSEPPTSMEISQEMPMVSCPSIVPRPTPMKRSKFFFNAAACALSRQVLGGTMPRSDPCQQPSTSNWVVVTHIDPKSSKTSRNHLKSAQKSSKTSKKIIQTSHIYRGFPSPHRCLISALEDEVGHRPRRGGVPVGDQRFGVEATPQTETTKDETDQEGGE